MNKKRYYYFVRIDSKGKQSWGREANVSESNTCFRLDGCHVVPSLREMLRKAKKK